MTNAERLRAILVGDSGYMAENGVSHMLLNVPDTVRKIQAGELILISRERVQSIIEELEGLEK